jgi:hypothetical protein
MESSLELELTASGVPTRLEADTTGIVLDSTLPQDYETSSIQPQPTFQHDEPVLLYIIIILIGRGMS